MAMGPVLVLAIQAATAPPPEPAPDEIVVVASRERFRMSAAALRAAQAAFVRGRPEFAPGSAMSFVAEPRGNDRTRGLVLRLTDGAQVVPVPVGPDGHFALPPIPQGKWWLEANAGRRAMNIRPLVLSPGTTRLDQRLGDVRLECRAFWAMMKEEAPLLAAPIVGMLDLAGACSSRRVGIYMRMPRPIREAVVREGARVMPVEVARDRRSYHAPLADRSLGNEARVAVTLE